jgi:hypothetical protein
MAPEDRGSRPRPRGCVGARGHHCRPRRVRASVAASRRWWAALFGSPRARKSCPIRMWPSGRSLARRARSWAGALWVKSPRSPGVRRFVAGIGGARREKSTMGRSSRTRPTSHQARGSGSRGPVGDGEPGLGYTRIRGALGDVGHEVGATPSSASRTAAGPSTCPTKGSSVRMQPGWTPMKRRTGSISGLQKVSGSARPPKLAT